jgi:pimeloyl-ACP methyl ester carboxylesterase
MRQRLLVLPALSLFLLLVAACSSDPEPTPTPFPAPEFARNECPFVELDRVEVICGTVAVPKDRSDVSRGTYDLAVAVLLSPNPRPAPEPVVYLAGGPGENALTTLQFAFEDLFEPFLADRDVVIFDQRGAGFSEPETACLELRELAIDLLDEALPVDEAGARGVAAANACYDRLVAEGVEFDTLNTAESAQDVHAIMRSLSYESWNLLGISYGTRLAQTVMRDRPEGVRAVILDSVVPIENDLIAQTPGSFGRALQALIDGCSSSSTCAEDFPDLESTLLAAAHSLNDEPQPGTVANQLTLDSYDSLASGADLGEQVFLALYSAQMIPMLPEMIALAGRGQVDLVNLARGVALTNVGFLSEGMQLAIQCQEEVGFTSESAMIEAAEPHGTVLELLQGDSPIGIEVLAICEHWGLDTAAEIENGPVHSDIPTLVLAGEYDPITPPSGGQQVAERLTNGSFLVTRSSGHAVLGSSGCAQASGIAFLRAPEEPADLSCAGDDPEIQWTRPLEAVEFEPFRDSLFGIRGLRPKGWHEIAPGAYSRSALGVVTLFQQAVPAVTGAQLIDSLGNAFAAESPLSLVDQITSASLEWNVYSSVTFGQQIIIAVADSETVTPFVMMTGLPGQSGELHTLLLRPIVEAFELVP